MLVMTTKVVMCRLAAMHVTSDCSSCLTSLSCSPPVNSWCIASFFFFFFFLIPLLLLLHLFCHLCCSCECIGCAGRSGSGDCGNGGRLMGGAQCRQPHLHRPAYPHAGLQEPGQGLSPPSPWNVNATFEYRFQLSVFSISCDTLHTGLWSQM